jgi:hypothetical protein
MVMRVMIIISVVISHHDDSSTRTSAVATKPGISNDRVVICWQRHVNEVEIILEDGRILLACGAPVRIDASLELSICTPHVLLDHVDLGGRERRLSVVLDVEAVVWRRADHRGMVSF